MTHLPRLPAGAPQVVSPRSSALLSLLTLVAAVWVVYAPALDGGFIWDDDVHVYRNLLTQPGGLFRSWFTSEQPNYWPVTWTVFWVQWKLWGMQPAGYHAVTVLLHLGCAVLLGRALQRLAVPGARLAALLFAVHPVNVETGAWISQQKNLLAMVFSLVCVLRYLTFLESGSRRAWASSAVAFLLALLSKSAAVPLPLVLIGCAAWRESRLRWRQAIPILPFLGLAIALALNEISFQYHRAGAVAVREDPLLNRVLAAGHVAWFYLGKIVMPLNLCFVYPKSSIPLHRPLNLFPWIAWALVIGWALWRRRSWGRSVLFGLGYFFVMVSPVLGLANIYFMRYAWMADHWQYAATPGPLAWIAGGLAATWTPSRGWRRHALSGGVTAIVLVLALLARQRAFVLADAERLWQDTIARNPAAWMARVNGAASLLAEGRADEAREQLEMALAWRPDSLNARLLLASLDMSQGRLSSAARHLDRAEALAKGHPDVEYERGRLALLQNRVPDAERHFERTRARRPRHAGAWAGLGMARWRLGRVREAEEALRQAVTLDPMQAEAWHALGEMRYAAGDLAGAIAAYEAAVRANPSLPNVFNDLGVACARAGRQEDARAAFREAVRRDPQNAAARANLERALREGSPR